MNIIIITKNLTRATAQINNNNYVTTLSRSREMHGSSNKFVHSKENMQHKTGDKLSGGQPNNTVKTPGT